MTQIENDPFNKPSTQIPTSAPANTENPFLAAIEEKNVNKEFIVDKPTGNTPVTPNIMSDHVYIAKQSKIPTQVVTVATKIGVMPGKVRPETEGRIFPEFSFIQSSCRKRRRRRKF